MNVHLSDEERLLRDTAREHLEARVVPIVADHEQSRTMPWDRLPELYELGYVRGLVPEDLGGYGSTFMTLALLMEEAGRCWGSLRTTLNVQGMVAYVLGRKGTGAQRRHFLEPLLAGERFGWFGVTETEAGSDAAAMTTVAVEQEDGGYLVTGRKVYITNAAHADFGILLARARGPSGEGITAFLVERGDGPFDVHEIPHMPVRATSSCELVFDGLAIPAGRVLGTVGRGLAIAMSGVNVGRLSMAMGAVGLSQACLEASIAHVSAREQFGRPLAGFQLVQSMVTEIATLTQTSRLLGYHAARVLDAGGSGRTECSMAKYYCGEAVNRAASLALQLHGGAGLMEETPVERYFRDAREATIPEGTSEVQVLSIGRDLLGVSAFT